MRSFLTFLSEARSSQASKQAAQMGLQGDGHGGWYDKDGKMVGKTEGGQLVLFKGREPGAEEEPTSDTQQQTTDSAQDTDRPGPADVEKTKGTLTIAFGRFNPPTVGHEKLINTVADNSEDGDYIIVPSRSVDKKKNPLDTDTKVDIMKQMYPQHADNIVNNPGNKTIFDVMRQAHNDGYANIRIVGGGDRVKEYEKLANKYNGSTYQFDNIEVVNAGDRDPDAEGVEGMSASKMRAAAAENDFRTFRQGIPETVDNKKAMEIFTSLQKAMGVGPQTEAEEWEIAPRLDLKALRNHYVQGDIFNIGDVVTHDATGMVGEIVRKGANHLICVTEDNKMFKTWTQDVSPQDLKPAPAKSTPKEREVGTDSLRRFLQRITPGEREQSFINNDTK